MFRLCTLFVLNMPRKNKRKYSKNGSFIGVVDRKVNVDCSEINRNSFAVNDDLEHQKTLQYLIEIFNGKVDKDVIPIIYSSCRYNAHDTIDALFSLSEDSQSPNRKTSLGTQQEYQSLSSDFCEQIIDSCAVNVSWGANVTEQSQFKEDSCTTGEYLSKNLNHLSPEEQSHKSNFVAESYQQFKTVNQSYSPKPKFSEQSLFLQNQPKNLSFIHSKPDRDISYNLEQPLFTLNDQRNPLNKYPKIQPKFITPHVLSYPGMFYPNGHSCSEKLNGKKPFCGKLSYVPFENETQLNPMNKQCTMLSEVLDLINNRVKVLIILRGLPGSGKSTLASKLNISGCVLCTDDYFYRGKRYCFDFTKLSEAHEWNRVRAAEVLKSGVTPVIIDNTNTESWEMKPYVVLGIKFRYNIRILEPDTRWKFKPDRLAFRNTHNVPKDKIIRMLERYEHNVTVQSILNTVECKSSKIPRSPESISPCGTYFPSNCVFKKERNNNAVNSKDDSSSACTNHTENMPLKASTEKIDEVELHKSQNSPSSDGTACTQHILSDELKNCSFELKPSPKQNEADKVSLPNKSMKYCDSNLKITCLKDLMLLSREDSEGNTSSGNQGSSSWSSQDDSDWDSITDKEEFLWLANISPHDNKLVESEYVTTIGPNINSNSKEVLNFNGQESNDFLKVEYGRNSDELYCEKNVEGELKLHSDVNELKLSTLKSQSLTKVTDGVENAHDDSSKNCDILSDHESNFASPTDELKSRIVYECSFDNTNNYCDQRNNCQPAKPSSTTDPKPQRKLNALRRGSSVEKESKSQDLRTISEETVIGVSEITQKSVCKKKHAKFGARKKQNHWEYGNFLGDLPNKINTSNWEFPAFNTGEKSIESNVEDPVSLSLSNKKTCIQGCDYESTVTSSEAFDFSKSCDVNDLGRNCKVSVIEQDLGIESDNNTISSLAFPEKLNVSKILEMLQSCFPDVSREHLQDYLKLCNNDTVWMSNILFNQDTCYNDDNNNQNQAIEITGLETNILKNFPDVNGVAENQATCNLIEDCTVRKQLSMKDSVLNEQSFQTGSIHDDDLTMTNCVEFQSNSVYVPHHNPLEGNDAESRKFSTNASSMSKFSLTLDPTFAAELEKHFGPIMVDDSNSLKNCAVEIEKDLAKQIYDKWTEAISRKCGTSKKAGYGLDDNKEKTAIEIQDLHKNAQTENATLSDFNCSLDSKASAEIPFAEVMNYEFALQLQMQEKAKQSKRAAGGDGAVKIRRRMLYDKFPKVDKKALDEILEANEYSLSNSIFVVEASIGQSNVEACTESIENVGDPKEDILRDFIMDDWSGWVYPTECSSSSDDNGKSFVESDMPEEHCFRQDAGRHYSDWQECSKKAKDYYQRGIPGASLFYRIKACTHEKKFREANKKAMEVINKNNRKKNPNPLELDLHGLFVPEAISTLESFIRERKTNYFKRGQTVPLTLSVITGKGTRSVNQAKLRPAVAAYLKKNKCRYDESIIGKFNITLFPEV